MSDKIKAKRILERWDSGIKSKDKKSANMPPLFDAVANELFMAGIDFDIAEEAMREAAKMMYPSPDIIRSFHKNNSYNRQQTVQELAKTWHESLNKAAAEAFYRYFDIDGIDRTKTPSIKRTDPKINSAASGDQSVDEVNREDFWKSVKIVSKDKPWLFDDEESTND